MSMQVYDVREGTPAYCAGIKSGDIIIAIKAYNGESSTSHFFNGWKDWTNLFAKKPSKLKVFIKAGEHFRIRTLDVSQQFGGLPGMLVTPAPHVHPDLIKAVQAKLNTNLTNVAVKVKRATSKERAAIKSRASQNVMGHGPMIKIKDSPTPSIKYSPIIQEAEEELKLAQTFLTEMKGLEAKEIASGVRGKLFNHLTASIEAKQGIVEKAFKGEPMSINYGRVIAAVIALTTIGAGICALIL